MGNDALLMLKKLLSLEGIEDVVFKNVWDSFIKNEESEIGGSKLLITNKGLNQFKQRFVCGYGYMEKGNEGPRHKHSNATEVFTTLEGDITETVTDTPLFAGRSFNIRKGAHHGFKANVKSVFYFVITEIK